MTACTAGNSTEMVLICLCVGLPKHVLHERSLLKYRVRRAVLHKMRPDAMQKNRNVTSEPCDKADDAKCSFRIWVINKNTHFSNGFCKFQVAISGAKRVHTGIIGGPKRHMFHDFALVPLSQSCFPPRAASFFQKMMPDAMRKSGNVTLEPCDKADDAKYSFPKGHKQKILIFPMDFANFTLQ